MHAISISAGAFVVKHPKRLTWLCGTCEIFMRCIGTDPCEFLELYTGCLRKATEHFRGKQFSVMPSAGKLERMLYAQE